MGRPRDGGGGGGWAGRKKVVSCSLPSSGVKVLTPGPLV